MIVMAWRGQQAEVSASAITGMENLEIVTGIETEDKESGGKGYLAKSKTTPASVVVELKLLAALGIDVETQVKKWQSLSMDGTAGRISFSGRDLMGVDMMLTECSVTDIWWHPKGTMTMARVALTFEQGLYVSTTQSTSSSKKKKKTAVSPYEIDAVSGAAPVAVNPIDAVSGAAVIAKTAKQNDTGSNLTGIYKPSSKSSISSSQ